MNGLDWAIIAIIGLGTALGFYWGVIRQVLSIVGLVAGIAVASKNYESLAELLSGLFPTAPDMLKLVSFLLIITLVSLVVSAIATALRMFVGLLFLGWLDHVLGGALGLLQSTLLVSALLAAMTAFPAVGSTELVAGSQLAPRFDLPVRLSLPLMPERFKLPNQLMFDL